MGTANLANGIIIPDGVIVPQLDQQYLILQLLVVSLG
jgi:hypothetical protein